MTKGRYNLLAYTASVLLSVCVSCMYGHPFVGIFPEEDSGNDSEPGTVAILATLGLTSGSVGGCTPTYFGGSFTGCPLSLSGTVTTPYGPAAGSTASGDTDGVGNAARFLQPSDITTDGTYLYVADFANNKIRRIDPDTGLVTTPYGPAPGSNPSGDADGTGNAARFNQPAGIVSDGANLFVTDFANNKIRQIVIATGVVTTLAGPAPGSTVPGDADGTGNAARFNTPFGIATDGTNLYVAGFNNNKIRQIVIATGVVTTLAGPAPGSTVLGDADGIGNAARFSIPQGIAVDGSNLYVTDNGNHKIRRIELATGTVTTFAGPAPGSNPSGDADGTGNAARFNGPLGVVSDGTSLYVTDFNSHKLRRVDLASAAVTTLAGPASGSSASGDTDGAGSAARFLNPAGLASDGTRLYLVDFSNNKIRLVQ